MSRPQNVGIKAMEIYFPTQCVNQSDLEKFDGVSEGKYTIGLGQTRMSFCDDREDIYSLALTTVSSLLRKYSIDPNSIGRLEVGTETLLDKSKSAKSVLMQLFEPSGNYNIEGIDNLNACYGGTSALFNSVAWVESSSWDGRDAIVVAGDIALYKKGNARPTGGAGCVAMLVGPDAPLVLESQRGTYMAHVYDFYKADFLSEYPLVDGQYSLRSYAEALDNCYKAYNKRQTQARHAVKGVTTNGHANGHTNGHMNGHANGHANGHTNGHTHADDVEAPVDKFDFMCFHSPTCKTVAKSYARLLFNDYLANPENPIFSEVPAELRSLDYQSTLTDKSLQQTFGALSKKRFASRVQPAIQLPAQCGNMYCASVYSSLISLISNVDDAHLQGKRIGLFSYGSGLASSMFSLKVHQSVQDMVEKLDLNNRLAARRVVKPEVYDEMCVMREHAHLAKNYTPTGDSETLESNTYYLTGIDDMFRRSYAIKS